MITTAVIHHGIWDYEKESWKPAILIFEDGSKHYYADKAEAYKVAEELGYRSRFETMQSEGNVTFLMKLPLRRAKHVQSIP